MILFGFGGIFLLPGIIILILNCVGYSGHQAIYNEINKYIINYEDKPIFERAKDGVWFLFPENMKLIKTAFLTKILK